MIVSTTNTIPSKQLQITGTVHAEIIYGANIIRDLFASIRDVVGGRAKSYEQMLAGARNEALDQLEVEAYKQGAQAIVGLKMDFEIVTTGSGKNNGMIVVTAYGTAVVFQN